MAHKIYKTIFLFLLSGSRMELNVNVNINSVNVFCSCNFCLLSFFHSLKTDLIKFYLMVLGYSTGVGKRKMREQCGYMTKCLIVSVFLTHGIGEITATLDEIIFSLFH